MSESPEVTWDLSLWAEVVSVAGTLRDMCALLLLISTGNFSLIPPVPLLWTLFAVPPAEWAYNHCKSEFKPANLKERKKDMQDTALRRLGSQSQVGSHPRGDSIHNLTSKIHSWQLALELQFRRPPTKLPISLKLDYAACNLEWRQWWHTGRNTLLLTLAPLLKVPSEVALWSQSVEFLGRTGEHLAPPFPLLPFNPHACKFYIMM
jgi:hypothetical protein